jgi:hypothetical protein
VRRFKASRPRRYAVWASGIRTAPQQWDSVSGKAFMWRRQRHLSSHGCQDEARLDEEIEQEVGNDARRDATTCDEIDDR